MAYILPPWGQLERYKPTKMTARYPRWVVGKPLLIGTSALAAFGDAMFGYAQGAIASAQVQPSFIKTIYGVDVTLQNIADAQVPIQTWLQGTPIRFKIEPWQIRSHLSYFCAQRLWCHASISLH